jgi:biopolymer transport protein ExbD
MRKHKKRRRSEEVELNLAAMLDMAFQLLTFFILTFKPAPVEGQVLLRMPPPVPITRAVSGQSPGSDAKNTNPTQGLNTLVITALSNPQGEIKQLGIGDSAMGTLEGLERRLAEILGDPAMAFDQVVIQVDSRLRYEKLMNVIDMCTRQKLANGELLSKLSFVELPAQ